MADDPQDAPEQTAVEGEAETKVERPTEEVIDDAREDDAGEDPFEPFDPEAPLMARGEDAVIRAVDWRGVLPFVRLFESARLAAGPGKLLLALAGILVIYVLGQAMDGLWYVLPVDRALPGEVAVYDRWLDERDAGLTDVPFGVAVEREREVIEQAYDALRRRAAGGEDIGSVGFGDVKDDILERRERAVEAAGERAEAAREAAAAAGLDAAVREARLEAADADERLGVRAAYDDAVREWEIAQASRGAGPFDTFMDHTVTTLNALVGAVLTLNLFAVPGLLGDLLVTGPLWGLTRHPVFFGLFLPASLCVVSLFGGAICRIAAVEFARDEKIGVRDGLRFAAHKFVSFLTAPLIPVLMLGAVGLLVSLGGLLLNIPSVGPIVVGAGFFLALLGGLVVTLVVVGLVGGVNLMYPCVAAEGSDSFDAISRSFSYLYARPWRLLFYSLVALVFGSLAYTVAHAFAWLVLESTHFFTGLLAFRDVAGGQDVLAALWTEDVSFGQLSYDVPFLSLHAGQDLAAFFIAFWVYLVIGLLGAFAASLYFCSSTVLYFLMRRDVDATEHDEVYHDPVLGE